MNKAIFAIATVFFATVSVFAGELVNVSGASGIALNGYDPVAFFTDKKPMNGDPGITSEFKGASYLFTSKDHKDMFEKNQEKYAPQYGGFCAYGVSVGALFPVDINTWQIKDGKLYLNLSPKFLEIFSKDLEGNIANAEKKWPGLFKKNAK